MFYRPSISGRWLIEIWFDEHKWELSFLGALLPGRISDDPFLRESKNYSKF